MIVDASALLAVFLGEPDAEAFESAIAGAEAAAMSPINCMEVFMRLDSVWGEAGTAQLDAMIASFRISLEPVDVAQLALAQSAFRRFGKGRHKAALNMGDCFAYALAKAKGQPILFKGNDFIHTDLESAV